MKEEKVYEIMSKVLSYWDSEYGLENCSFETIHALYRALQSSPHDDGNMRVSLIEMPNQTYLVPFEDMILFGLEGGKLEGYGYKMDEKTRLEEVG